MKSIAIICGGPSLERGISLNSARSAMDHLLSLGLHVEVVYINQKLDFYHIDNGHLYSNTPSDFDFKLKIKLEDPVDFLSKVDIVLPAIHGKYGEDGELQKFLEKNSIPFIGSSSESCRMMFSKSNINSVLRENGFKTTKLVEISTINGCSKAFSMCINNAAGLSNAMQSEVERIFKIKSKVVVKPDKSGSSIGVSIASSYAEVYEKINEIFAKNIDNTVIVEEFCEGAEFTVIVLQNSYGLPVAFVPTEIEVLSKNKIFDYRKKYLPTNSTCWYTPPRFGNTIVKRIMSDAEKIFQIFNARDFIRIDGWLLDDGRLVFTDINPVSGLEQNSFVFQQSAWCGLSHSDLLCYILKNAGNRYNLEFLYSVEKNPVRDVFVLFGGESAERQVSLMSGTNIWLKLLNSTIYRPKPCLLDGDFVWFLPYVYTMNHTVEEIKYNCEYAVQFHNNLGLYVNNVRTKLGLSNTYKIEIPHRLEFDDFLDDVKSKDAFLFLGLHGGIGEDGSIQALLEKRGIEYNGSNSAVSSLCMNKYASGKIDVSGVTSLPKILSRVVDGVLVKVVHSVSLVENILSYDLLKVELNSNKLIIKPCSDGCSAGVVIISSQKDLDRYISLIHNYKLYNDAVAEIEMPNNPQLQDYIVEPLVEVDSIIVQDNLLIVENRTGWIEMTVGIVEEGGSYYSLNPSVAISENDILSLEEKFQGGTGINLTPPPEDIVSKNQLDLIKKSIEEIGLVFGLQNYARIDIFFNVITNQIILIEINTLPALTPSTVIFHQAIAEQEPIYPLEFLEGIISKKLISWYNSKS